ncbi:MAG: lysophospholipid acyltransferase family protein [Trueperaceae bacterium]|nr:lysophospholipid acyltransferase family protein [Trueperaceae bacterium]
MARFLLRVAEHPWFYWTARFLFKAFARVAYGLRIEGTAHLPREGGMVLAVNHFSGWDPPMVGVSVPREISFMAKKELFVSLPSRLLFRGLHAFPVDRSANDIGAIKEALRRLQQGRAIGIFVQGTRHRRDAEALDGAAFLAQRGGVPLVPAAIHREGRRFRVRFGEPFRVEGRGRPAIRDATRTIMKRVNELLPSHAKILPPDEAPPEGASEGARDPGA